MVLVKNAHLKLSLTLITLLAFLKIAMTVRLRMVQEGAMSAMTTTTLTTLATIALKMCATTRPITSTSTAPAKLAMTTSILILRLCSEAAFLMSAPTVLTSLRNGVTRRLVTPTTDQITKSAVLQDHVSPMSAILPHRSKPKQVIALIAAQELNPMNLEESVSLLNVNLVKYCLKIHLTLVLSAILGAILTQRLIDASRIHAIMKLKNSWLLVLVKLAQNIPIHPQLMKMEIRRTA